MSRQPPHIGACAVLALVACESPPAEVQPETRVEVTRGDLVYRASFYGELEARKRESIHTPDFPGWGSYTVDTVLDDGTKVEEGQVVLTFVTDQLEDELRMESSDLAIAQAELNRLGQQLEQERIDLELNVERLRMEVERAGLYVVQGKNLISELELAKARLELDKAKLAHRQAKHQLAVFDKKRTSTLKVQELKVQTYEEKVAEKERHLEMMKVRAPASGVLYGPHTRMNWVRGKVAPGSVTRPGDKLLEIPDFSAFDVVVHIRQHDVPMIEEGQRVEVVPTVAPKARLGGTIKSISNFASTRNERMGTERPSGNLKEHKVIIELDETLEVLRPGGTAQVGLVSVLEEDALLIPIAALIEVEQGYEVERAGGGRTEVQIGKSSTVQAAIMSGLAEGDEIRLNPEPKATP